LTLISTSKIYIVGAAGMEAGIRTGDSHTALGGVLQQSQYFSTSSLTAALGMALNL
jgi:hypothetical protein